MAGSLPTVRILFPENYLSTTLLGHFFPVFLNLSRINKNPADHWKCFEFPGNIWSVCYLECCVSPEDFLHEMVGRGLPVAAQCMTAISLCKTDTSLGSSDHRGGTNRANIIKKYWGTIHWTALDSGHANHIMKGKTLSFIFVQKSQEFSFFFQLFPVLPRTMS